MCWNELFGYAVTNWHCKFFTTKLLTWAEKRNNLMITTQHNLAGYFTKWNAIKQDLHVSLKSKTQKSNKIIWTVIVLCLSFIDIAIKF